LRAQRSNPESFRGGTLDCFAALAMTVWKQFALAAGQSRVDRGPEAAMFRRELRRAGMGFEEMGFEQEDRDGEDDQGGGEQDEAVAHEIAFNRHRGRMMASSHAETITARDP
jgi:hypothetical protein